MLQAIVKKGQVLAEKVPTPNVSDGGVLIKVVNSCISAGTEMSGVKGSGKSLIKRAMEQPENIAKVVDMARSIGIQRTVEKIRGMRDIGAPTGYSISGVVVAVGNGVSNIKAGDHVAAAGAGLANHAEFVDVPQNLVMRMPKGMSFEHASTVTLGGIAMQGVRRADLRLGEFCVVTGAGILGLLTIQMLKLAGVRVAAVDLDPSRLKIAKEFGAELCLNPNERSDIVESIQSWTGGYGTDCVIFTAATSSSAPLSQSFQMCRRKGKVVLVGVVGLEIDRADIYAKELDFQISTSYGPGRYDKSYEEKGLDYPYAYVRWTENRNMEEYLRLLNSGLFSLDKIINGVYPIEEVTAAYEALNAENKPLMILLSYESENDATVESERKLVLSDAKFRRKDGVINVALVGAGGFATSMHLPNIATMPERFRLHAVMSRKGHNAKTVAKQFNAAYATTDLNSILSDDNIDLVMIATRHDSHASLVLQALKAGKHVFVEKPLATNQEELNKIKDFYLDGLKNKPVLFTGFNRRFSRYAQEVRRQVQERINPVFIQYRMNAGYIPLDHWVHEHGGRMVGEACHIIDLMSYLVGERVYSVSVDELTPNNERYSSSDNKSITLKYHDGSIANIQYFSVGSKKLSKEYMEVHFDGKSLVLDDYRSLTGFGVTVNKVESEVSQKGQLEELEQLYLSLQEKDEWPIDYDSMIETTELTFNII